MTVSDYYSTAAALEAVYTLDPSSSVYDTGFQWLSGQLISSTDYLVRQIIVLTRAGQDASTDINSLLLYRDDSGHWSTADDDSDSDVVDILDTALALQALKAANYADYTVQYNALSYLTKNQNTDGGWGFYAGNDSNTYITSTVLRTLTAYNSVFLLQDPINAASAFLSTKQNSDGGYGSSPSTVYDTALAIIASIESGQSITTPIQNAITYLTSTQSANGSWNDDPYSTALALQALAAARPNLTVSSITLSDPMPQEGEETTITAEVKNSGYDIATNIIVRYYLGDPSSGGTQLGTDQIIPSLSPNSSASVSVTPSFTGTGGKTIYVRVDPDNFVSKPGKSA